MKVTIPKRILSVILCMALIIGYLPLAAKAAGNAVTTVSDPSTMDSWKDLFLSDTLSTENVGSVWTDKSVFTDDAAFANTGIVQTGTDSFLVALSAIASNMTVTGMSNVPTDTMLVLDVSGSMNDNQGNNNVAKELVEAANEAIGELLATNKHNRVGIVLYSGPKTQGGATSASDAVLILPLGRYTTGSDNQYLNYNIEITKNKDRRGNEETVTTESVSLDGDVVYEGTSTAPNSVEKEVVGATYIQKGLALATAQFTAAANITTVEDPVLGTVNRTPVMVLMSDGDPTVASTAFTNPGDINLGDGTRTSATIGFVTQLTAAYSKAQVENKYGVSALFYTLGLGTAKDSVATSVLNPANSSVAINDLWTAYNSAAVGGTVTVQGQGDNARKVTKIAQALEQEYVDEYFSVESGSSDLAQGLKDAFAKIVGTIQLQSRYFPTLVVGDEDLSGYISFVDKIGEYMEVTDIKGILINNTLYSGADLAKNFASDSDGGDLGSYDEPTELGKEMIAAVRARLGLANDDVARTLIGLAYEHGQLSYTNESQYSNYIGWYANAAGEFLGFWHDGITTLPEATGDTETDPVFVIKSYGYLGAVDESHGVSASDMMYATVQVRENIATGEQTVVFAVPAALIPVVSYQVTLDQNGTLSGLEATGAEHPIRLVYEVALDSNIDTFTLTELVSQEYLDSNTDADGNVSFYTNQYETDNTTGYGKDNTYAYFNPSRQNEHYYYLNDTPVYSDKEGTLYKGEDQPDGTFYRAYTVYVKDGNALRIETHYREISKASQATAIRATDGSWYIPAGDVHTNLDGYAVSKAQNVTDTLENANVPFVDAENHSVGDVGYNFYVGATLGNNGRLTLAPATGIALTKTLAPGAAKPASAFRFVITNVTDSSDSGTYSARVLHTDGSSSVAAVQFESGKATVALNAGETLYINGMSAGTVYTVEEEETLEYLPNAAKVEVEIVSGQLAKVEFINADRGTGNLTITKEILHSLGSGYEIPDGKNFTIQVQLSGIGTANKQFQTLLSDGTSGSITTDANGSFVIELADNQQIAILGLPGGTVATVTEPDPGEGFTAAYWEDGQAGDGVVTIADSATVSVTVMNSYEPKEAYPVNVVLNGTKIYTTAASSWNGAEFEFQLQKWDGNRWITIATDTASESSPTFDFNNILSEQKFTATGAYYYQVLETNGGSTIDGITYDATLHTFGVIVTDADMDGQLEIAQVISYHTGKEFSKNSDGNWQIDITFQNHYNASGCSVVLDVQKELVNLSGSPLVSKAGFRFGLYDADDNLIAASELTDGVGEARIFLQYSLEDVGEHTYTLKEIIPDTQIPGMTYDETSYTVKVLVSDNGDGTTSASIVSIDGKDDYATPVFTNTYAPDSTELPLDFVNKELTGRNQKPGEFEFEVRDADGNSVTTGTNDAQGNVVFEENLHFDTVGSWFYTIVETTSDGKGITTDKTVYTIVVTVTDENGKLKASYSVLNVVGDSITFQNTYAPKETSYTVSGTKTLIGRVLLNDEFTFLLEEADENGAIVEDGISLSAKNFVDGSFSFPAIPYIEAGTYYYVVSEKVSSSAAYGIHYDETKYLVTVTVKDNQEEGLLEVQDVSIEILGGDSAEAITFTNNYIPNPTFAQLSGNKILEGKVLNGGEFSFNLYASDADWTKGQWLETVENSDNGSFTFENIEALSFDTKGTWYYLVSEENGGQVIDGITYDSAEYRVMIEVTDDLIGQLHATVHIYDSDGIPQQSVEFRNIYTITGDAEVTLNGSKTLIGKDLADEKFTFELFETGADFAVSGEAVQSTENEGKDFRLTLRYDVDDIGSTFYYVVMEKNAGMTVNGVTYSTAEYYVTVAVQDNGVGGIETVTTITNGTDTVGSLDFTNTYTAAETEITIEGSKTLANRELVEGEFTFELYETGNDFVIAGDPIRQETNGVGGSIRFADIGFDEAGLYYFVMKENTDAELDNITYDLSQYNIVVEVVDRGYGSLEAAVISIQKVTESGEEAVESITFENIYTPDPEDLALDIVARKTVNNTGSDAIGPKGFRFLLENITLESSQTAESDDDGLAVFNLSFTKDDIGKTYTYKLSEINDGRANVTYSTVSYNISISISLSEDNTLVATVLNDEGAVFDGVGDFVNVYHCTPSDNPKTGDTYLSAWIPVMVVSAGAVVMLTALKEKKKEEA